MEITFNTFAKNLSTRALGKVIRGTISENLKEGEFITFNFNGVSVITNSFADECFGKLLFEFEFDRIRNQTTFVNINNISSQTILFSFKARLNQLSSAVH